MSKETCNYSFIVFSWSKHLIKYKETFLEIVRKIQSILNQTIKPKNNGKTKLNVFLII